MRSRLAPALAVALFCSLASHGARAASATLDSGISGSTVNDNTIVVSGTVDAPSNSSLTVGGIPATITSDGHFFVNDVPLQLGANSIGINITTQDGQTFSQSFSVTSTGPAAFKATIDTSAGLVPLDVRFAVSTPSNAAFATIEYDYDGNGTADFIATSIPGAAATHTYNTNGLQQAVVKVKDANGAILFTKRRLVYVATPAEHVAAATGVYNAMLNNLAAGNVEAAVSAFCPGTQERYRALFNSLGSSLASVVAQVGTVQDGMVLDGYAELVIVRNTSQGARGFVITLVRGKDGTWRIETM